MLTEHNCTATHTALLTELIRQGKFKGNYQLSIGLIPDTIKRICPPINDCKYNGEISYHFRNWASEVYCVTLMHFDNIYFICILIQKFFTIWVPFSMKAQKVVDCKSNFWYNFLLNK